MKKGGKDCKGITLIALVVTIVVLLILAGVTINFVLGKDGIIAQAKLAAEKTKDSAKNEQSAINEWESSIEEILNRENKLELPEVDMTTTITCVTDESKNTYLGEDPVYIRSCKDENTFNDDIFTVNNCKVVEPYRDDSPGGNTIPQGYFAEQNNRTRQMAYEFDVACQKFEIVGGGGFRLSVWDESKNKWKYVQSSTGITEEVWAWYLVTFPDAKKRTVRIESFDCFVGLVVKKEDVDKVTKTTRQPGKKVLFVGNSWTNGTLGTQEEGKHARLYNSYVNVLSEVLGFECLNNGVGATGYSVAKGSAEEVYSPLWYENRIEMMVTKGLTPDIIVIGGAGNDIFCRANELDKVAQEAQDCINKVKELNSKNNTDMKLVIIGVEKVTGGLREDFENTSEPMNDKLKEVALKNNIPFIDFITNTSIASDGKTITKGATPFVLAEYIGNDVLHPTVQGHQKIGIRLAEEVQAILKYEKW